MEVLSLCFFPSSVKTERNSKVTFSSPVTSGIGQSNQRLAIALVFGTEAPFKTTAESWPPPPRPLPPLWTWAAPASWKLLPVELGSPTSPTSRSPHFSCKCCWNMTLLLPSWHWDFPIASTSLFPSPNGLVLSLRLCFPGDSLAFPIS